MGTRELPVSHLRNSFNGEQPTNYMSLHPVEDVGVRAPSTRRFGQASLGRPGINAAGALRGSLCGVGKKRRQGVLSTGLCRLGSGTSRFDRPTQFSPGTPLTLGVAVGENDFFLRRGGAEQCARLCVPHRADGHGRLLCFARARRCSIALRRC